MNTLKPCPEGQRSGRTQWMIDILIADLIAGTPRALVFGSDIHHCEYLLGRIQATMKEFPANMPSTHTNLARHLPTGLPKIVLFDGDQTVAFMSMKLWRSKEWPHWRKWSHYYDHYALGEQ